MERSQEMTMGSSTVTSSPSTNSTLVLKHVRGLQQEMESDIKEKIDRFKKDVKGKAREEIDRFIDKTFDEGQAKVMRCFSDMKAEVKSHAPRSPEREKDESNEHFQARQAAYETDKENYEEYVATTATFMDSIVDLFTTVLVKVKDFFNSLWNWIKAAVKNIAEKVASFLKMIKETINNGLSKLLR